jgi:hypothetical protein
MKTPRHVIIFRLVTAAITATILITAGFGAAARGPLGGLGARTSQADNLLHAWYARGWLG